MNWLAHIDILILYLRQAICCQLGGPLCTVSEGVPVNRNFYSTFLLGLGQCDDGACMHLKGTDPRSIVCRGILYTYAMHYMCTTNQGLLQSVHDVLAI